MPSSCWRRPTGECTPTSSPKSANGSQIRSSRNPRRWRWPPASQVEKSVPLWLNRILHHGGALAATVILVGIVTAAVVRSSPGFDADERLLDPRLDAQSRAFIKAEHAANHDVLRFYVRHIGAMVRGDWGVSTSLNAPVRDLVSSRLPDRKSTRLN